MFRPSSWCENLQSIPFKSNTSHFSQQLQVFSLVWFHFFYSCTHKAYKHWVLDTWWTGNTFLVTRLHLHVSSSVSQFSELVQAKEDSSESLSMVKFAFKTCSEIILSTTFFNCFNLRQLTVLFCLHTTLKW